MTIFDEIKQSYKTGSVLHKLIYINVGVFLALHIGVIILVLANQIGRDQSINEILFYLAVPSDLSALARKPWTIVTYMFTHGFLWHILFNLMILYWFGRYFIEEFGVKKILGIYLLGGLGGAVLFVFFYNIFPFFEEVKAQSIATGASASVMAIVIAVATAVPNRQMNIVFIGPVVGFLFANYYRKGKDITRGFDHFMDSFADMFRKRKKMKVKYKRPADDFEYNKQKASEQQELDRILDKISKGGYDSLTKSEKEKLFNMKK